MVGGGFLRFYDLIFNYNCKHILGVNIMKTKVKLLTFIIVLFLPLVVISQEKEKGIFHYLDKQAVDLDERQQELFDVIRSWPQTKNGISNKPWGAASVTHTI